MKREIAAGQLAFPEGPVVLGSGRVAVCEQFASRISVFDGGRMEVWCETGGSPNGAALGGDGCLYVAQNGGVVGNWRAELPLTPCIQRVWPDGSCETLCEAVGADRLFAPNDLCFGPDGRLYFTDPAHGYNPSARGEDGRIYALSPQGRSADVLIIRLAPVYCNGIGFTADRRLVWVESYDCRVCTLEEGHDRLLCTLPAGHVPDGFAIAADGRLFIATLFSAGITVIGPDGEYLEHIPLEEDSCPTNCAFEGNVLWVTDAGDFGHEQRGGRLWRLDTDATGLPLHVGSL
jgi:gluconolactonase